MHKVLTNDEFWNLVDQYEAEYKGQVKPAIDIITEAYIARGSSDTHQAICDYELLRRQPASEYAKSKICRQLEVAKRRRSN